MTSMVGAGRCLGRLVRSLSLRDFAPAALSRQGFIRNLSAETGSPGIESGASPPVPSAATSQLERAGDVESGNATPAPTSEDGLVAAPATAGAPAPLPDEETVEVATDASLEAPPEIAVPLPPKTPPAPEYEGESMVMREIRLHTSSMWGLKGQIISGEIIAVGRDYVVVDLGFKSLSRFFKKELSTTQIYSTTKEHKLKRKEGVFFVGDRLQFRIDEVESPYGDMSLTTHRLRDSIQKDLVWKDLMEAFDNNSPIQGRVLNPVDRGYAVGVGGFVCFCPINYIQPKDAQKIGVLQAFKIAKISGVGERRSVMVLAFSNEPRPPIMKRNRMNNFGAASGNKWV